MNLYTSCQPAKMSSKPLILLTGATGFIGFRTLILALQAGHPVRCAIRDPKKASTILTNPSIQALKLPAESITFVHVPDFTITGAFSTAIQDARYVIHVASPLPAANPTGHETPDASYLNPAIRSTIDVLEASHCTPTVRKVIITSSVVAMVPCAVWQGTDSANGAVYTPSSRQDQVPTGPFTNSPAAYMASKVAQLRALEDWTRDHSPTFSITTIHPSWVLGRNDLATSIEGLWASTNRWVLDIALGNEPVIENLVGACVHVDDVARAHILALDEKVKRNHNFILNGPLVRWEDVHEVVKKHFPDAVADGTLLVEGKQETVDADIRGEETEKVLGFEYLSFEEMVRGIVAQYLEMRRAA